MEAWPDHHCLCECTYLPAYSLCHQGADNPIDSGTQSGFDTRSSETLGLRHQAWGSEQSQIENHHAVLHKTTVAMQGTMAEDTPLHHQA